MHRRRKGHRARPARRVHLGLDVDLRVVAIAWPWFRVEGPRSVVRRRTLYRYTDCYSQPICIDPVGSTPMTPRTDVPATRAMPALLAEAADVPRGGRADALAATWEARIRNRQLAAGARLPSVRRCAELHGVSPATVVAAYDRLQARGLVEARRQRGYFVRGEDAGAPRAMAGVPAGGGAVRGPALAAPVDATALIRGMFRQGDGPPGPGMGTLPESWLDAPLLQRALRHALRDTGSALRYGDPLGDPGFRDGIALRLRELGIAALPAQVVSTVGATHALDIVARTLLQPGDAVLVDEPGWAVEFARLARMGMRLLAVPRGAAGPDLEVMERLVREHRPRLYVTVSVLHNPTGNCIDAATAHRILMLAERHDMVIVEDDTYAWLGTGHEPRLAALDGLRRTVYISGFSKILAPDWRLGFLAAPAAIAERCTDTKLLTTLTAPSLYERAMAWLLAQGLLRRHAERIVTQLGAARARVVRLAQDAGCSFSAPPQGLFGWVDTGVDTAELAARMAGDRWLLAPGTLFSSDGRPSTLMRVNFATSQDARFWRAFMAARKGLAGRRRSS